MSLTKEQRAQIQSLADDSVELGLPLKRILGHIVVAAQVAGVELPIPSKEGTQRGRQRLMEAVARKKAANPQPRV